MQYENGIWVFGYGSLIWNPGFEFETQHRATLHGFARTFCLWSIHYRGTEQQPGLVLGLDPVQGGQCEGVAYFVGAEDAQAAHTYLRERELVSYAYHECLEELQLENGQIVQAICYVVDKENSQYAGGLSLDKQAHVIKSAKGTRGENLEYLHNTAAHLEALGVSDPDMFKLLKLLPRP